MSDPPATERAGARGRFLIPLAVVLALGLALQVAIQLENVRSNPLAGTPVVDAAVYWEWAGAIGRGDLVAEDPFFSAPLYPYVVGVVRALGGGLPAVYVLQIALHLATAAILALVGRRRFGPRAGLVAAGLYLLLADPAYYVGRILACTLQAFCVAVLLERLVAAEERPGGRRAVTLGLALGVTCLAYPPLLPAIPIVAVWAFLVAGRGSAGARSGLLVLAPAIAAILPATWHNHIASGELIPISAHAGITFYHGNNETADGTFSPLGVANDKYTHNLDALEQARAANGGDGGWKMASSHFFGKGLDYWRGNPGAAVGLFFKKAWWFLTGRNYGDMYVPRFEREDGFATRHWLAPLPVAWWTFVAFAALGALVLRERGRHFPEALLFLVPFAVTCVFWYSPRYRMPAVPALALLAGWGVVELARWRAHRTRAATMAVALVVAVAAVGLNAAVGFDRPARYRAGYEMRMGRIALDGGRLVDARARFEAAAELGSADAAVALADLMRREGAGEEAIESLRSLADARPGDGFAQRSVAVALAQAGRPAESLPYFERAIAIDANDYQSESGLGGALSALDRDADATRHLERALEIRPGAVDALFNLAVVLRKADRTDDAVERLEDALESDPDHEPSRRWLVTWLVESGRHADAIAALRGGLDRSPGHRGMRLLLAWHLATAPDGGARAGPEAVEIAEALCRETGFTEAEALDTLAAALAETGEYGRAVERAVEAAAAAGEERQSFQLEIEARIELYRDGEPYRQGR